MGTFIITIGLLSLFTYIFQLFWKAALRVCYHLLLKAIDVVKKIIVATKRFGKAVFYLYKRYKNGRVFKVKVETEEEEVDIDMLPEGLQDELEIHDEVVTHTGDIMPEEFE